MKEENEDPLCFLGKPRSEHTHPHECNFPILPAAARGSAPCEESMRLAMLLVDWMSDQKYGEESILHAVVCCDFVSRNRFIRAVAFQIESSQGTLASVPPQAETDVCGAPQGEEE